MPRGWGRGRGRGWFGRGRWTGPWPGNGPFSYLPPWQRPGWIYGRRAYWPYRTPIWYY
ncbi:MAG: hypothetical protein H0Z18_05485 [Thermococcus sp.]|uniref:hypothetical protein n=1 Tax=Thermococcus sp. TaxID=35749 RepID=UPI001DE576A3|nr:hypothetical protein [Thermococcus sp.]MBO8174690.1 hypothetical protein [Thermococcus sp.]